MTTTLRNARDLLVADASLRGTAFSRSLGNLLDEVLEHAAPEALSNGAAGTPGPWALLALGSYARDELCPGSDVDLMLLRGDQRGGGDAHVADAAAALWYPLWDSGFALGQSVRTAREALAVADEDLNALTALLDVRLLAGDRELALGLAGRVATLAARRRARLLEGLANASEARRERPGPIAEMLEPDLKDGAGGLRDIHALGWIGSALRSDSVPEVDGRGWARGVGALEAQGYLTPSDIDALQEARSQLLDARVALQRTTGRRTNQLALQDHDAVARTLRDRDADTMVRRLARAARSVAWIVSDAWDRLSATRTGPSSRSPRVRELGNGVVLRDQRVGLDAGAPVDALRVLVLAAEAARRSARIERATLERLSGLPPVVWTEETRAALIDLLRSGRGLLAVCEALDHVGVLEFFLPEWSAVRAFPQRNAYHRFTVDRHLLEVVIECAALLDPARPEGEDFDGEVAHATRADVLLLGGLLHDIGKTHPGDHSEVGAHLALDFASRIRLDRVGTEELAWLVQQHLLLADTATRRDLAAAPTISRFAELVGDRRRLDLLYALTIADSRATGAAAWNSAKASLVRELYLRTRDALEPADAIGAAVADRRSAARERYAHLLVRRDAVVEWTDEPDGGLEVAVACADRAGLLATVAGSLALAGFDIRSAALFTETGGRALEVFTGADTFGRLRDSAGRQAAEKIMIEAIGEIRDISPALRERVARYRRPTTVPGARDVRIGIDQEASPTATVVEIHAPDDVGLLARVASVITDLGLDVSIALVSTLGDRVVDVFYLHDARGGRIDDPLTIERIRATLMARLTSSVTLGDPHPA